jgi:hypothetical protein
MYLFTKDGFYSVVCGRQGDGSKTQPIDPEVIQIRARVKSHLENLATKFPNLVKRNSIRETTDTDHRFRIIVPRKTWLQIMDQLASGIDYDNFKTDLAHHTGVTGRSYLDALHQVWAITCKLQKNQ